MRLLETEQERVGQLTGEETVAAGKGHWPSYKDASPHLSSLPTYAGNPVLQELPSSLILLLLFREPSWSCHAEVTCIKLAFVYVYRLKDSPTPTPGGKKEVSYY